MNLTFSKYQGTGNDFILVDNRQGVFDRSREDLVAHLCDRRFGIGADGLMLLQNAPEGFDFEMVYYNSDGREGSMCGNGGRCIVAFARQLGVIGSTCRFIAVDGPHDAIVHENGEVELKMIDVTQVEQGEGFYFMNTGSPHYVMFVDSLPQISVVGQGRSVRYSDRFKEVGTNVNFVEILPDGNGISIATYERGVEDETLSCGTGATACAIAYFIKKLGGREAHIPVQVKGGQLHVHFKCSNGVFEGVWLCGPAQLVFEGSISLV